MHKIEAVVAGALLMGACHHALRQAAVRRDYTQQEILAQAKGDYEYVHDEKGWRNAKIPASQFENKGKPKDELPKDIHLWRAKYKGPKPGPSDSQILAKIVSDKGYPDLNIEAGTTYIWRNTRDPNDGDFVAKMVPEDMPMKVLNRGSVNQEYAHLGVFDHKNPHLVGAPLSRGGAALGVCFDDPACGSQHCGYSSVQ